MLRMLALVPAALILAGCGTAQSSSEGSGPTKNDASTSRIEWTMAGSDAPGWATLTATGIMDYANEKADFVMTSEGKSSGEMHATLIGRETYLGAEIDGTMRWGKEASDGQATGTDRFLPGPGGTNPDRVLAALEAASTKVERLGAEKVRDVETTHYKAHLDNCLLYTSDAADE